jgi:hypothetical protein
MVAVAMINFCMLFSPLRNHNKCRSRNDSREQKNSNFAATDGSNCPRQFFYADALEIVLLVAYCSSKEHGRRPLRRLLTVGAGCIATALSSTAVFAEVKTVTLAVS